MFRKKSLLTSDVIRNFVFGVEDSLVSTVGLVSGIAAAEVPVKTIVLTGTILILVEAFSMAVGSLLSDNSADEFDKRSPLDLGRSILGSFVMFISYLGSGFLVLLPYIFLDQKKSFLVSIVISLLALGFLGIVSATLSKTSKFRKSIAMMFIGGSAIILGIIIGNSISGFV